MVIHALNGNGFGGVESLMLNLIKSQTFKKNQHFLVFLGEVPSQFNNYKGYIINLNEVWSKRGTIKMIFAHADFKKPHILFYWSIICQISIIPVSHGVLISAASNILVKMLLILIKIMLNVFVFGQEKVAISKISGQDYYIGKFKVVSYTPENFNFLNSYKVVKEEVNEIKILHVGRFHSSKLIKSAKNQDYIYKICQKLDQLDMNYSLLFIGGGKDYVNLNNKYNLKGSVSRIEYLENDLDIYKEFNFFLFPSVHESYGQTLLWAQLSGANCICSSNICEEVNLGSLNYLPIDNNSIDLWIESINIAINNEVNRRDLDKEIKKHVYTNYYNRLNDSISF